MKKFIFFIYGFIAFCQFNNTVSAQCSVPCPPAFLLRDSTNCNNVDIRRNALGTGYTNNPISIRACKNTLMKYCIIQNDPCFAGIAYNVISVTGGTLQNFNTNCFAILWGNAASGSMVISFSTPGSAGLPPCNDTIHLSFTLFNTPIAAFTANPQPACFNNPTTINFNSSSTTNANGFYWNFGDGFTSTLANPSHAYSLPGTYTVTLLASNTTFSNGSQVCPTCIDTAQQTVTISNLPGPAIECIATVCAGDTAQYCTTASGCSSYVWTVTGGNIIAGQNTNCVTVVWGSGTPQGTINLVATGCTITYCTQGTTVSVPIIPSVGTITGNLLVCVGVTESYSLPSWPGTTYNWNLSSGGSLTPFNTNTNTVTINWTTLGTHTLTCSYFDSALNCGGTASLNILVRPTMSIAGPTSVCANQSTNLNATRPSAIPVNCNWTISPLGPTINSGNGTDIINVTWPNVLAPTTYSINANSVVLNQVCNVASYVVTVHPAPIISTIVGPDSICPNQTYVYKAISNLTGTFSWNTTNASSVSFLGVNNDSIQVTWGATGPYNISVFQTSIPNGCVSNTLLKNIFRWPTPILNGPVNVCADATVTYTVSNILNGSFNWFVTPPSFGTLLSGQGTNSITIKWHGNNNPGSSNIVYLHYGVCGSDSIAITISEPPIPVITPSGTLCGPTGVTLSTGATGTFNWTGPGGPVGGNTSSISNINIPGNYTVTITNFNGTGCTVTTNYNVPDVGRPVASISATNVLNYCLPNVPNMNLVAVNGPGYTFQWYLNNTLIPFATNPILPINTLTLAGSYSYYCVVSLGTCVLNSNTIVINLLNCPPPVGCFAAINVTNITGCNPFTLSIAATAPLGATIVGTGNPTIQHLEDNYLVSGLVTRTYTSVGYKIVRVCADVTLPNTSICRVCKDTVVHVTVAPNFNSVVGCKKIDLFDASTVVAPATINSYAWSVGFNPGNAPVPPIIANFNNAAIPNPVLTLTQSGSYIVSMTITSGSCTVTVMDTFNVIVPNADFNVTNSCVGTSVPFTNLFPAPTNFWDFGDAATSYTSPTFHAYATPGLFAITHIVTDVNGCKDTIIKPISIVPPPTCTVTNTGPLSFCFNDSVILGSSCVGLTNFQWYNNGIAIPGQIFSTDTVKQTGNYSFIAFDVNGCKVISDTVSVIVNQGPNVNIISSGTGCSNTSFTVSVPPCFGCSYQWLVDGIPQSTNSIYSAFAGFAPYTVGTHTIKVIVQNSNGCIDSSSLVKTFYTNPTLTINVTGPTPYCSNNLYNFNATTNASLPSWSWNLNNNGITLSTTNLLNASAAGTYNVTVTDGITGCKTATSQVILPSPALNLFPIGCDSLCDTATLFLPLPSLNGNLSGYTINWYNNAAPTYSIPPIGSSVLFPLNSLTPGNHNLSVIVTSPNGCMDTSNIYSVYIKSCNPTTLPIRSLVFSGKQLGNTVMLQWVTEQEIDIAYYEIERSFNGYQFMNVSRLNSQGNSNSKQFYQSNDPITVFNSTIFYRLKIVDKQGHYFYSTIIKITPLKNSKEEMFLQPNLVNDRTTLFLLSNHTLNSTIQIFGSDGKLVESSSLQILAGMNQTVLNCSQLSKGIYYVIITTKESKLVQKFLKN